MTDKSGKQKTVYIETSIVSYLTARPSRNLIATARQYLTLEWWEDHRQKYAIFISNAVIAEASLGDKARSTERLNAIRSLTILEITDESQDLAEKIIAQSAMPKKAYDDALHLAIASCHNMDFLLTWNCRHLANAHLIPQLRFLIEEEGRCFPQICTPEELMGG